MKVSNISFKGYLESGTENISIKDAKDEIKKARPYLKLIGDSLPYGKSGRDLFLKVENDRADDIVTVNIVDNATKNSTEILRKIDHELLGSGFWLVGDTFKELETHSATLFNETAKNFCRNFSRLERDLDPKYKEFIKGVVEVITSSHDHCC